ncbi:MAG TPA: PIN domain-containing protein [Phototrophicaceae bacterium]|nr:PIN domain-containing protein [Phototrophicaceae bacterium]
MPAVADTSYVLAVAIETDKNHEPSLAVYHEQEVIYLPQTTLAEIAYFLTRYFDNKVMAHFLVQLPETKYRVLALEPQDFLRTAEILNQYADSRVDFVDATVAAVAERLKITRILTLDQRDFRIIRPKHIDYFDLLPAN